MGELSCHSLSLNLSFTHSVPRYAAICDATVGHWLRCPQSSAMYPCCYLWCFDAKLAWASPCKLWWCSCRDNQGRQMVFPDHGLYSYHPNQLMGLISSREAPQGQVEPHNASDLHSVPQLWWSSTHTKAYQLCITEYVGALEQIHPGFNPWPNHHATIHIYDFLNLFGPVHSWWAFLFECLIGIPQRLP